MLTSLLLLALNGMGEKRVYSSPVQVALYRGNNFSCTVQTSALQASLGYKLGQGPRLLVWPKNSLPKYFGAWVIE